MPFQLPPPMNNKLGENRQPTASSFNTVCLPAAPRVCAVIDCERQEADNNNTEFANTH